MENMLEERVTKGIQEGFVGWVAKGKGWLFVSGKICLVWTHFILSAHIGRFFCNRGKETIVQRLKNGDIQALRLVYELFYKSVFQAAFFITNDPSLAEDAVHEVFLKLSDKFEQLKDSSKLEAWLCRTSSNVARDILRRRSRSTLIAELMHACSNNQISPETMLLINEEKHIVKQYLERLQPEHKRVLYLKYYQDLSVNEISKILGVPVGTAKSRLIRAREALKNMLLQENRFNHHKRSSFADKGVK